MSVVALTEQEQRDLWAILWYVRRADMTLLGWTTAQKRLMDRLIAELPAASPVAAERH